MFEPSEFYMNYYDGKFNLIIPYFNHMKQVNYNEFQLKPLIEPTWLYLLLRTIFLMIILIIELLVIRILLNLGSICSGECLDFSISSSDVALIIILSLLSVYMWQTSYVRIYDNGIMELRTSMRKIKLFNEKKRKKYIMQFEIKSIKSVDVVYIREMFFTKKLGLKIVTDSEELSIDVKEHNEFIKELLKHNPNIKTPELPII